MEALVIAESSGTINNDAESAIDYYQGNFQTVSKLVQKLEYYCSVETRIITDSNGLISGSTDISEKVTQSDIKPTDEASSLLIESADDFDIVVVLLTTDVFRQVIIEHWGEIVNEVSGDAIWCLGTSRSAISDCDIDDLRKNIREVFIYERVGVAPIDNTTRKAFLASVESRAKELQ